MKQSDSSVAAIEVSDTEYLRLSDFERFNDGSGYRCRIAIRSGEFGCFGKEFYFDDLPSVVSALHKTFQSLQGSVEMRWRYERESISFLFTNRGRVVVKSTLTDYRDRELRLALDFDQTYMQQFVAVLESINAGFTLNTSLDARVKNEE